MTSHSPDPLLHANTPLTLSPVTYDIVHERMVNQDVSSDDVYHRFGLLSFTDQMARIASDVKPDYYLFTANSAIPVADAVRGYYERVGSVCPPLGYVAVKAWMGDENPDTLQAYIEPEIARLSNTLSNLKRGVIVDQFVESGNSINVAKRIVLLAGSSICGVIRGNWYHDAYEEDVDLELLTSTHAAFMTHVGKGAAEKVLAGDYNLKSPLTIRSTD